MVKTFKLLILILLSYFQSVVAETVVIEPEVHQGFVQYSDAVQQGILDFAGISQRGPPENSYDVAVKQRVAPKNFLRFTIC